MDSVRVIVEVQNDRGLHGRTAAKIVKTLAPYDCKVTLDNGINKAQGDALMDILFLGATKGTRLSVSFLGPDAIPASKAMVLLFETKFGENQ